MHNSNSIRSCIANIYPHCVLSGKPSRRKVVSRREISDNILSPFFQLRYRATADESYFLNSFGTFWCCSMINLKAKSNIFCSYVSANETKVFHTTHGKTVVFDIILFAVRTDSVFIFFESNVFGTCSLIFFVFQIIVTFNFWNFQKENALCSSFCVYTKLGEANVFKLIDRRVFQGAG